MAKKQPQNQLGLDFTSRGNRIVLMISDESNRTASRTLFDKLLRNEWSLEPAGETADISPAREIMDQIGHRLLYPEQVKVARVYDQPSDFRGFAAIYNQKGWVFVNETADPYERRFDIYFLVAALGLHLTYPQEDSLRSRAEQLVFEALMPQKDVETFFRDTIKTLNPSVATDMSDFFKVPYAKIPKRAYQLQIISEEQYQTFSTVKPSQSTPPKEIFITRDSSMVDDLESYLFGEPEDESE